MRRRWLRAVGVVAVLAVSATVVQAQTAGSIPGSGSGSGAAPSCAVTTARIGSTDVTQFFGLSGGPASFNQNFGLASSDTSVPQQCIRLQVDNPSPGDLVPVGAYTVQGFAFDPTAPPNAGSGISGVQVFLGDPNTGGQVVGSTSNTQTTSFGLASERAASFGQQFLNSGFRLTVQIPTSANAGRQALFVTATASSGQRVGTVAVPVSVAQLGLPTPIPH
jgi:hypothetical protein